MMHDKTKPRMYLFFWTKRICSAKELRGKFSVVFLMKKQIKGFVF
jgi:hypothetical protein